MEHFTWYCVHRVFLWKALSRGRLSVSCMNMRLTEIDITNFRSIKQTKVSLLDTAITTFIGANGSGKSNLLKAMMVLKDGEDTPTDEDFHAKSGPGSDDDIVITGTFLLEDRDAPLLEAAGLKSFKMDGFNVIVEKELGEVATLRYEVIGYNDKKPDNILRIQKELIKLVKALVVEEPLQAAKAVCLEKLEAEIDDPEDNAAFIAELTTAFEPIKDVSAETGEKVLKTLTELKSWLTFNVNTRVGKIFDGLNIELLQLTSYSIENNALITELEDRTSHPFLYDLLQLAGKNASSFTPTNTPILSRIKTQASDELSKSISGVWASHDLTFQIDKHGESLVFMVFTPQGQQVSLTDLSDGEQWFLKFYVRLAIAQKESKQIIWLFDEPGRDLHTSSQVDLKGFFETISVDAQVIYTSHLAMMIPWHRLERIFAVENSRTLGSIVHKRFWKDTKLDSPLKEALSTFVGEELLGGKEHLIVEGVSDYFFLQGWIRHFQQQTPVKPWAASYGFHKRILVPVDGIEKIPLYCWFLGREVKNKVNWVVIVDSAAESTTTAKKMTDTGLGSWTNNVRSVGEAAGGNKKDAEEIEGIFKPEEYVALFEGFYAEEYPDCMLPTLEEVLEKQKTVPKLTKAMSALLCSKNPQKETNEGKAIELDKTGIAQYAYKLLAGGTSSFSKDTENRFGKILENIDKTYDNQVAVETS